MSLTADRLLPAGAVVCAMVSLTAGASIAQGLFPHVGAQGVTALRLALGFLILSCIFHPWRARITRQNALPLLGYGLSMGGLNFLFYLSIATIPLAVAIAIELIGPLVLAIATSRRRLDFLWIVLAVVGLTMLLPFDTARSSLDPAGVMYALGAGACWALYIVCGKLVSGTNGAITVTLGMGIAALAVLPIGIAHAGADLIQPHILGIALIVAVLSSAIPYSLEMIGLRRLPIATYGTVSSAEPAVGGVVAFLILGQQLTLLQSAAILLIILGSIGSVVCHDNIADRKRTDPLTPPIV